MALGLQKALLRKYSPRESSTETGARVAPNRRSFVGEVISGTMKDKIESSNFYGITYQAMALT